MLSRGFDGAAPDLAAVGAPARARPAQWAAAMAPAMTAVAVCAAAWVSA
jgi:cobalt/nickel transport system permease protein